jgi:hypothetical protein
MRIAAATTFIAAESIPRVAETGFQRVAAGFRSATDSPDASGKHFRRGSLSFRAGGTKRR